MASNDYYTGSSGNQQYNQGSQIPFPSGGQGQGYSTGQSYQGDTNPPMFKNQYEQGQGHQSQGYGGQHGQNQFPGSGQNENYHGQGQQQQYGGYPNQDQSYDANRQSQHPPAYGGAEYATGNQYGGQQNQYQQHDEKDRAGGYGQHGQQGYPGQEGYNQTGYNNQADGQPQTFNPDGTPIGPGGDQDRGLMASLIGGGAGAVAMHKATGGGILSALGGAAMGAFGANMLEDKLKKHKKTKKDKKDKKGKKGKHDGSHKSRSGSRSSSSSSDSD